VKYHLGCGSHYLEGYLNVDFPDANHNVNHDIRADLYTDILQMHYEECEEIRSHHFFEHFNYFDTFALLYKWTNALKSGGKLTIDLPDLEELCRAYLSADTKTKFLVARYLYGSHEADWAYHINGWSKETLEIVLQSLGYIIQDVQKYGSYTDKQPNCGLTISSILQNKPNPTEMKNSLIQLLALYKNGNTEFENSLCDYFVVEMNKNLGAE
jgi:hypothetical protein